MCPSGPSVVDRSNPLDTITNQKGRVADAAHFHQLDQTRIDFGSRAGMQEKLRAAASNPGYARYNSTPSRGSYYRGEGDPDISREIYVGRDKVQLTRTWHEFQREVRGLSERLAVKGPAGQRAAQAIDLATSKYEQALLHPARDAIQERTALGKVLAQGMGVLNAPKTEQLSTVKGSHAYIYRTHNPDGSVTYTAFTRGPAEYLDITQGGKVIRLRTSGNSDAHQKAQLGVSESRASRETIQNGYNAGRYSFTVKAGDPAPVFSTWERGCMRIPMCQCGRFAGYIEKPTWFRRDLHAPTQPGPRMPYVGPDVPSPARARERTSPLPSVVQPPRGDPKVDLTPKVDSPPKLDRIQPSPITTNPSPTPKKEMKPVEQPKVVPKLLSVDEAHQAMRVLLDERFQDQVGTKTFGGPNQAYFTVRRERDNDKEIWYTITDRSKKPEHTLQLQPSQKNLYMRDDLPTELPVTPEIMNDWLNRLRLARVREVF